MIKTHWMLACSLLGALVSLPAWAEEAAGMVKTSTGQVSIEREGKKIVALVGATVFAQDKLRTGPDGAVGVTLRDNTLLSAGPNSIIAVEKFVFDGTSHDGNMSIGIRKGTLSVATGKIAKKTPESVDFRTPTSVLGVRGTEFVIEVVGGSDE